MNGYLLDTHIGVWLAASEHGRVAAPVFDVLTDPEIAVYWSAASSWEVATKAARGHHDFTYDADDVLNGLTDHNVIPVDLDHAVMIRAARLAWKHRDPFDRILVAQSRALGLRLVTADRIVLAWNAAATVDARPGSD